MGEWKGSCEVWNWGNWEGVGIGIETDDDFFNQLATRTESHNPALLYIVDLTLRKWK